MAFFRIQGLPNSELLSHDSPPSSSGEAARLQLGSWYLLDKKEDEYPVHKPRPVGAAEFFFQLECCLLADAPAPQRERTGIAHTRTPPENARKKSVTPYGIGNKTCKFLPPETVISRGSDKGRRRKGRIGITNNERIIQRTTGLTGRGCACCSVTPLRSCETWAGGGSSESSEACHGSRSLTCLPELRCAALLQREEEQRQRTQR